MRPAPIIRPALYVSSIFSAQIALLMLVPAAIDSIDGNPDWQSFVGSAAIIEFVAVSTLFATRGALPKFNLRFAFMIVGFLWMSTAVVASLPLYMSNLDLSLADAVFEAMSGITTTGSTVMGGLDDAPRGILIWRSILQWIGGIGILAMGLLMFPFLRVGGMQFFRIESSDKSDKPSPHFIQFSIALIGVYLALTIACALAYALAGMSVFDAVNHAMTTVSTGGYSTHDRSIGYFQSDAILWISTVFMLLGALPFSLYVGLLLLHRAGRRRDPQIAWLLGLIAFATVSMSLWLVLDGAWPAGQAVTHAMFHIVSVVTTTGYAAQDYTLWGPSAIGVFLMLTMVGGCAGSTAGGLKTYRLIMMAEMLRTGVTRLVYPHGVIQPRYGGRELNPDVMRSTNVFLTAFLFTLVALTLGLAFTGLDLVTALTGAMTALANVGPGLGEIIGPVGSFAPLTDTAKWLLTAGMLLGRLEIMAVLVLFAPAFWSS